MEKKENKYESPLIETVEVKNEGVICASCSPVNTIECGSNTCGGSDCADFSFGGGGSGWGR